MKPLQRRYGFRKYRGIGLASVAIASIWLANPSQEVVANSLEQGVEVSQLSGDATVTPSSENQIGSPKSVPEKEEGSNPQAGAQIPLIDQTSADQPREATIASSQITPIRAEEEVSQVEGATADLEATNLSGQGNTDSLLTKRSATELGLSELELAPEIMYSQDATERLRDVSSALQSKYSAGINYDKLSAEDKARYEAAVYNEYANHLVENAMGNIQPAKTYAEVPRADRTSLFTQFVIEERRLRGNPTGSDPKVIEAVRAAEQRVIDHYNQNLYSDPTLTGYAQQDSEAAKSLIKTVLSGQNLTAIENQRTNVFRGLYLLHSQYNFEAGLPEKLVTQDKAVTTGSPIQQSPLQNLIRFGGYGTTASVRNKSDLANILRHNKTIYTNHIQPVIGTASQLALVEKLAAAKQETSKDYFLKQTEATVQVSDQVNQDQLVNWLHTETNLLVPLLAQGKGTLVGFTRDSVVLGLNDVYKTAEEVPALEDSHQRGTAQTSYEKLETRLNDLENFNTFLREASRFGSNTSAAAARPLVVRDSLVKGSFVNGRDGRVWQTKENNTTIRNLFAPLGDHMSSPTYRPSSNIEGEKQSENHFVAYNTKVLGQDKKGVTLYSHEMTHANDERLLFDGTYGGTAKNIPADGNRRQGQGAEVYARSLFEARDNTQTTAAGNIRPVFNLNTSVPVTDGSNNDQVHQIQPTQALNTPEKLATYQHKLIKLLMWMEVKEAQLALDLSEDDRRLYFNKVEQKDRTTGNSTNDHFVATTTVPNTLKDLVNGSYVTAGFTINGTNRLGEVVTDGYHFVPLLDSFYGANYAPEGKNTVGDISFKRNAHEILGWYGFDAMLDYLSGRYESDQEFLTALRNRQVGKADILTGKVESTPEATKLAQYEALLNLELVNVPKEIKDIFTTETLSKAIQDDLAVLRAAKGNNQTIYSNMTNVRNLKQKLLSEVIETTNMMDVDPSKQILGTATKTVTYRFNFEGADKDQFPTGSVELPASHQIADLNQLISPENHSQLIRSVDKQGEWQFQGWTRPDLTASNQAVLIEGRWLYKAYQDILPITNYLANPEAVVGSLNQLVTPGHPGKRSAFNQAVIEKPINRLEKVGTKPKVETISQVLSTIYKADDQLEFGQPNRVEVSGQPKVITTTTTYRLEGGSAVANIPKVDRAEGVARVEVVGTKPTVERVETESSVLYEADDNLAFGSANVLKQIGQPGVSIKTTSYRLDKGQAIANQPLITVESGRPTIYRVGTKPKVMETVEILPTTYKSDDTLDVGQPNRIEIVGQPRVITTTTTYRLEGGSAVANTPMVSRTEGVARVEVVGTKPTVTTETIDLPVVYEEDPGLAEGSANVVKQVGQPTVVTTTITYRLENGHAVANDPQVTTVLGQAEIQLVGIKQEQNGGSDTTAPLPNFDPSADDDGDGYSNGDELTVGSDPHSASSVPARQNGGSDTTAPLPNFDPSADDDGDGYSNGDELTAGSDPHSASSVPARQNGGSDTTAPLPNFDPSADDDGDGYSNSDELTAGSNPHSASSVPADQRKRDRKSFLPNPVHPVLHQKQQQQSVSTLTVERKPDSLGLDLDKREESAPTVVYQVSHLENQVSLPKTGDSNHHLALGLLGLMTGLVGFLTCRKPEDQ